MSALQEISLLAKYGPELVHDRAAYSQFVPTTASSPETADYLAHCGMTKIASVAMMTKQVYDMAHVDEPGQPGLRQEAARFSTLALLLTDIVDDEIDSEAMALPAKFSFLDAGMARMFAGTMTDFNEATAPNPLAARASLEIADYLYDRWLQYDDNQAMEGLFGRLVPEIKAQFLTEDLAEHLTLSVDIGACCLELAVCAIEQVDQARYPELKQAMRHLGSYIQLLDDAYEIDDDLQEGVNSYATVLLRQEGDNRENRRAAQRVLLQTAEQAYHNGWRHLEPSQQPTYSLMRKLFDVRYRGIKRLHNFGTKLGHSTHEKRLAAMPS